MRKAIGARRFSVSKRDNLLSHQPLAIPSRNPLSFSKKFDRKNRIDSQRRNLLNQSGATHRLDLSGIARGGGVAESRLVEINDASTR
jgi:hypothetical protein